MSVVIFKDITTEGVIASIEENSKKYHEGFYADMSNLPERKQVKESAAEIGDIIKALETSRIAITKANTAAVNKEHDAIVKRLEAANLPFTTLIDEYKKERAKVLAEEKRVQAARDLSDQIESDHEIGLLMNKSFAFDRAEEIRIQSERDESIRKQAVIDAEINTKAQADLAVQSEKTRVLQLEANERYNKKQREDDVEHKRSINQAALSDLTELGLTENNAKIVIEAIAKNLISNITINY